MIKQKQKIVHEQLLYFDFCLIYRVLDSLADNYDLITKDIVGYFIWILDYRKIRLWQLINLCDFEMQQQLL